MFLEVGKQSRVGGSLRKTKGTPFYLRFRALKNSRGAWDRLVAQEQVFLQQLLFVFASFLCFSFFDLSACERETNFP